MIAFVTYGKIRMKTFPIKWTFLSIAYIISYYNNIRIGTLFAYYMMKS